MPRRFSVLIRRVDDNALVRVISGFETRDGAEEMARQKRDEIRRRKRDHYVTVDEQHRVVR